jgi:hypothetical protein
MHIPRAICGACLTELRPVKNGVTIEMMTKDGEGEEIPYYKIESDLYGCKCGTLVFIGFGSNAVAEHYQSDYASVQADTRANFAS